MAEALRLIVLFSILTMSNPVRGMGRGGVSEPTSVNEYGSLQDPG